MFLGTLHVYTSVCVAVNVFIIQRFIVTIFIKSEYNYTIYFVIIIMVCIIVIFAVNS